ncbi:hypothetical protein [Fervidobacterium thailandense]|uniref:Uncharacterized protein n=2 Tax=Fervidobacterium thailandense TaxID=1008305 RepID=A0A1E3G1E5_9BACT|nr:hypothetical protein [Fervidobacterium thailandense]ODN30067.1 hypothetical protein A4H02_07105 [Fervidobacterium thailandense]
MVKVFINGVETTHQASEFENFGDFLRKLIPEGQVLKSLKINGKDVPISFVDELKGARIDEDITIEMELVNAVGFLVETLKDVLGYIEHVKRLLPEVSRNLIMNSESGWRAIKDLADGISAMENLRTSTRQITKLTEEELNMVTNPSEVMEVLRSLLSALDARDNLEVSDVVENKIPVVLNYYIEYFSKVLEALRTTN